MRKGHSIYAPGISSNYDLIAEKEGTLSRVQLKYADDAFDYLLSIQLETNIICFHGKI
jgi:hypothetical protein